MLLWLKSVVATNFKLFAKFRSFLDLKDFFTILQQHTVPNIFGLFSMHTTLLLFCLVRICKAYFTYHFYNCGIRSQQVTRGPVQSTVQSKLYRPGVERLMAHRFNDSAQTFLFTLPAARLIFVVRVEAFIVSVWSFCVSYSRVLVRAVGPSHTKLEK